LRTKRKTQSADSTSTAPTPRQIASAHSLGIVIPAGATSAELDDLITARITKGIAEGEFPSWDSLRARVNDFAIRSFRDGADRDYIAARMAFRAQLIPQFLWAGLQAIEKYFKCIHVLNRVPLPSRRGLGHDISAAYDLTVRRCFDLRLSESSKKLIEYLNSYGRFRYLEISYHVLGREQFELDRAVWEIRRYCRVFDEDKSARDKQLKKIEEDHRPPYKVGLQWGFLEDVLLTNMKHSARAALIYQNPFFGARSRKRIRGGPMYAENAPLWLYPEMLDEVRKYAHLPDPVIDAYKDVLADRINDGTIRVPQR
jgi:hypothetical protein